MKTSNNYISTCGRQNCEDLHSWGPGIRNASILHYVIKGRGFLESDGKLYNVEAGHSFILYPYVVNRYYPDPNNPWEYVWVNFSGPDFEEMISEIPFEEGNCLFDYINPQEILPYFTLLIEKYDHFKNQHICEGLFRTILGVFLDKYDNQPMQNRRNELLNTSVLYIRNNYSHVDFSIEDMCRDIGVSRITLYRLFKNNGGVTPKQYLVNYRIGQAKIMLMKRLPIKSTAISCGFLDPMYFSRVFREKTGLSPQEFRRKYPE